MCFRFVDPNRIFQRARRRAEINGSGSTKTEQCVFRFVDTSLKNTLSLRRAYAVLTPHRRSYVSYPLSLSCSWSPFLYLSCVSGIVTRPLSISPSSSHSLPPPFSLCRSFAPALFLSLVFYRFSLCSPTLSLSFILYVFSVSQSLFWSLLFSLSLSLSICVVRPLSLVSLFRSLILYFLYCSLLPCTLSLSLFQLSCFSLLTEKDGEREQTKLIK